MVCYRVNDAAATHIPQMTEAQPTFSWAGVGRREGTRVYYDSFNFSGELYSLGDCVYLLPEEEGALPYIATLVKAFEDTLAVESEKLVIEVQWFERRGSVPPALGSVMADNEVVESDLRDTNLVGCIDKKAVVVRASSATQACELLPASKREGEWHFCRGVLQSATQQFKTYEELGRHVYGEVRGVEHHHEQQQQQQRFDMYGITDNSCVKSQTYHVDDTEMTDAAAATVNNRNAPATANGPAANCAANSRSRRAAAAARVAAAAAAAGAQSGAIRGIPGKVCCECGATQTPQWREGPLGPKTLCNACGVRYQRSQSKAKSNKRNSSERARSDKGSPQQGRAPKHACLSRLAVTSAAAGLSPTADGVAAAGFVPGLDLSGTHCHSTRSLATRARQQQQQRVQQHSSYGGSLQQEGLGLGSGGSSGSSGSHYRQQRVPGLGVSHDGLHYYEDEGSPPNMHTHILEDADDEDVFHHQFATREKHNAACNAADSLHSQQQQQQVAAAAHHAVSAAFCGSVIGSPSSNMILTDQLQPGEMPLLSLDDKDSVLPGLGGPDTLDASLTSHSLSPLKPRGHRLGSATAAGHSSSSNRLGAAAAACASPGRLIAAMVQGLKLPTPLSLNGPVNPSTTTGLSPPPVPSLLPATSAPAAAPAAAAATKVSVGVTANMQSWGSVPCSNAMLPVIGSSSSLTPSSGTTPTAATAACFVGADSHLTSTTVSSCDTMAAAAAACNGLTHSSVSMLSNGFVNGTNNCLLAQLRALAFRATSYAPEIQGLAGLYPGPQNPEAMQKLVQQLEHLPQSARVQLQHISAAVEDNLSKAKAADAAVIAVTQVLAAKKQVAAEARQEVENSIVKFKQLLSQISPDVAAAAAANGSGSVYCSPEPTPSAAGCATMGSGCLPTIGGGAQVCCGVDCVIGSGRLGTNSPRALVNKGLTSHPTQGFEVDLDKYGSNAAAALSGENLGRDALCGDHSDADDLIRDPEEGAAAATVKPVAAAAADTHQQRTEGKGASSATAEHQQQQCTADGSCCDNTAPQCMVEPVICKVEQPIAQLPGAAAAVVIERRSSEPASTSSSSDGLPATEQQQQQQVHESAVSRQQSKPETRAAAQPVLHALPSGALPAADAAPVAA